MRLRHFFSDFIEYGLLIDSSFDRPGQSPSYGEVAYELSRLLAQAEDAALRAGYLQKEVELAAHAVVAWIDERLAKRGVGLGEASLQKRRFNTHTAGNRFYTNLDELPPDADELREIFFLVLSLGFEGQYEGYADRQGTFGRLLDGVEQKLRVRPAAPATFIKDRLTPQPYETTAPPPVARPSSPRAMLLTILALALLLPVAALFWAGRAPALPALTVVLDPRPSLTQLAQRFECADLTLDVGPGDRPSANFTGYVRSAEDRDRLLREAAQIPGLGNITGRVDVHAWPFCEILQIIKPYGPTAMQGRRPINLDTANRQRRLREGDNLELRLILPEMSGFPTLFYVTATGTINQIYPNVAGQAQPRGTGFVLEQKDILPPPATFDIECPFGEEMVIALLSPTPLFQVTSQQPAITTVALPELRRTLEARNAAGQALFANHIFLTTEAGPRASGGSQACRPE